MEFPVYRKYKTDAAFFEILSGDEFRELKIIGSHYELHHIKAKILPERTYIDDLINKSTGYYVESDSSEFYAELKRCQEQRKRLG